MTVVINGSGTMTGLAVGGFNDNIITKNEMATGGAWAPAGTVLQVVSSSYSTAGSTTSTSYVSTGLTATITPTSATSKILIVASCAVYTNTNGSYSAFYTVFRGTTSGTNLGVANGFGNFGSYYNPANGVNTSGYMAINYLDSPSTTSAQVYTFAAKSEGNSSPAAWCQASCPAVLTLMEIAA